jgi:hypothetical protein
VLFGFQLSDELIPLLLSVDMLPPTVQNLFNVAAVNIKNALFRKMSK